jgi:hypothetical protein
MYNQNEQQNGNYPLYPYPENPAQQQHQQQQQQPWAPTDAYSQVNNQPIPQQGWYIPPNPPQPIAGPSNYAMNPVPTYPPDDNHTTYQPPASQHSFSSAYTTPSLNQDTSPASGPSLKDKPSAVKKKRKKIAADDTRSPSEVEREKEKEKEKRTKTGRACDACVSQAGEFVADR